MRILDPFEEKIRNKIRDELALKSGIGVTELQQKLEKVFGRTFHHSYLRKLVFKVQREALIEIDRTKIEERISFTRENYRMARERLVQIIYWEPNPEQPLERKPNNRDVVEACKNLVMLDLAVLSAEVSAGMYRSEQEAAQKLHYAPMPEERRTIVIQQFITWGMLPKAQVESIVPALPHGNTTVTA